MSGFSLCYLQQIKNCILEQSRKSGQIHVEAVGNGAEEDEDSAEDRRRVIQVLVEMHSLCLSRHPLQRTIAR